MEAELNYQEQLGFYWACDTVRAPVSHFSNMLDEIFIYFIFFPYFMATVNTQCYLIMCRVCVCVCVCRLIQQA